MSIWAKIVKPLVSLFRKCFWEIKRRIMKETIYCEILYSENGVMVQRCFIQTFKDNLLMSICFSFSFLFLISNFLKIHSVAVHLSFCNATLKWRGFLIVKNSFQWMHGMVTVRTYNGEIRPLNEQTTSCRIYQKFHWFLSIKQLYILYIKNFK